MKRVPWAAIGFWALVGALGGLAVLSLLTIGVFIAPVVVALGVGGLVSQRLRRGLLPGLLLGASLAPLWMAWLNRSGPGQVCETTPTSQSCADQLSPWPFLAAAVVLLLMVAALVRQLARETVSAPERIEVPGPT